MEIRSKLGWGLGWVCLSACGGPFGDGGFLPPIDVGGGEAAGGAEVGGALAGGAEAGAGGAWSATPEDPPIEGTRCLSTDHCGEGLYCRRPAGQCFGFGHCAVAPADCGPDDPPVCTCNGEAAANRCAAGAAGENVAFVGACGVACGWGQPCPGDQICHPGPGRMQDFSGFCGPPPSDCGADNPVCGADGRAQPNECAALANGGWIETLGPCGACASAAECWNGADGFECREVCVRPTGRCDEVVFGTCGVECGHDMCAWQVGNGDPVAVCGCNGRDYPAACEAEWVGARVAHEGACGAD